VTQRMTNGSLEPILYRASRNDPPDAVLRTGPAGSRATTRRSPSSGGSPRSWICDSPKAGALDVDLYDPKLKRAYRELAEYHCVVIDPPRVPRTNRMWSGSCRN
jgi:hypothetical protein